MNEKHIYYLKLTAKSAAYFGGRKSEELLKNASGKPFITGNSIGGALRAYLRQIGESEHAILNFMGGVLEHDKRESTDNEPGHSHSDIRSGEFVESRLYISDGIIESASGTASHGIVRKDGTAVDPGYGTALNHHKYKFDYLESGFTLSFRIECDVEPLHNGLLDTDAIQSLIRKWVTGIHSGKLTFGGKKSTGFGQFEVLTLERNIFKFDDLESLDDFIFTHPEHHTGKEKLDADEWAKPVDKTANNIDNQIVFSLAGSFPYGVYQSFTDDTARKDMKGSSGSNQQTTAKVTGLLHNSSEYFIPATSMKGLLRNEVRLLLLRMLADNQSADIQMKVDNICAEMFGSKEQTGKLIVEDMRLAKANAFPVEINRPLRKAQKVLEEVKSTLPIYNKIDRLTGGVLAAALKHQNEIQGEAKWNIKLRTDTNPQEQTPYLFPIIYVLRKIGSGKIPVGGRTVIGLGQFMGDNTVVSGNGWSCELNNTNALDTDSLVWLESSYNHFKTWLECRIDLLREGEGDL
ncbi:RAMP superfamily CRISPR-associated protein [Paenibacillus sp. GCM10012307]|uniref:CRISPR type III-associated protein domain-containing protein n=1 Tax=Paenibacillus roseus TaxID=2798579 RepID=A0A934J424_9BACL|nr:RAMP superfamily CRISPR-associated protein [Paenibacillus roseus]MBJ6359932.1 hypothetical protein [Paenibacillus roseus]